MFSGLEAIFSITKTVVEVPEIMFSALQTMFWTIKAIIFILQTTV
jgi:hypothetical protein